MLASNSQTIAFSPEHSDARQALTLPVSEIDEDRADTGRAGDFLVASPYTSQPHLLNLQALNTSQQLLAKALVAFQPLRDDYATASYAKAFNWDVVINELRISSDQRGFIWKGQHFYIVVFRSQVPQSTNRVELGELDRRSHAEATKSGGLLKYWFGIPDENGRNLATCKRFLQCTKDE